MRKIILTSNIIFSVISLFVFISPLIPPSSGWVFGFLAFLIPFFIFLNLLQCVYLLFQKQYLAIFPGILLLWGFQFLPALYSIHNNEAKAVSPNQFRVLSFNASYFRKTEHWIRENYQVPEKNQSAIIAKTWLQNHEADIYCFQEFYDDPHSDFYNYVHTLAPDSTYSVYLSGNFHRKKPLLTGGVAIISKYPMLKKGEVFTEKTNDSNRSIYGDLLVDADTIRIINLHFQSMRLNALPASKNFTSLLQYVQDSYKRIKSGLLIREKQAKRVLDFIKESPHPVIVVGDFNEIPFGYVYRKFNVLLDNAFENAGHGFGFSLNTTFPFLRIDQQFFDKNSFEVLQYHTFRELDISEHYPIQAVYRFIK